MSRSRKWAQRIGAPLTLWLLRGLWSTYRIRVNGEAPLASLAAKHQPVVLTFWHGELIVGSWYFLRMAQLGFTLTFLISPSKDGDFAVRILDRIGGQAVRGSATRSGVKALKGLYRAMTREGRSPIILPDGPRGPNRHSKKGAILLSQLAQAPIVPIAIESRPDWRLRTWDRHLVPPPFSRVAIEVGTPYIVPKGLDEQALENQRKRLDDILIETGRRARSSLGRTDP